MKSIFSFVVFFTLLGSLYSQSNTFQVYAIGCGTNQVHEYRFDGVGFEAINKPIKVDGDKYYFETSKQRPYTFFGTANNNMKGVFIPNNPESYLVTNCQLFNKSRMIKADNNPDLSELLTSLVSQQESIAQKQLSYLKLENKKEKNLLKKEFQAYNKRVDFILDSIAAINPQLVYSVAPAIQKINPDLKNEQQIKAWNLEHFFDNMNLQATVEVPFINNAFGAFVRKIQLSKSLNEEEKLSAIRNQIGKVSEINKAYALGAAASTLLNMSASIGTKIAEDYINKYKDTNPVGTKVLNQMVIKMNGANGSIAPEITGTTPDGKTINVSDYKGKYLLIDFWASWCGPCRRENPNVVKVYNKYKEKGFEILGVSLDQNKDRWVKAIEQDQLTWEHISDLKGWASELSKPYGVRSIPHTVLVDPTGRIIATKLRAHTLEQQLSKIFGE